MFTRRVTTVNYYSIMLMSLILMFATGNLSSEFFSIPTFGVNTATLMGISTAVALILALFATRNV